jgi:hypothetical protein
MGHRKCGQCASAAQCDVPALRTHDGVGRIQSIECGSVGSLRRRCKLRARVPIVIDVDGKCAFQAAAPAESGARRAASELLKVQDGPVLRRTWRGQREAASRHPTALVCLVHQQGGAHEPIHPSHPARRSSPSAARASAASRSVVRRTRSPRIPQVGARPHCSRGCTSTPTGQLLLHLCAAQWGGLLFELGPNGA